MSLTFNRVIKYLSENALLDAFDKVKHDSVSFTFIANVDFCGTERLMYMKVFPAQNDKSLVNEIIGYLIAKSLDLPTPEYCALINVPTHYIHKNFEGVTVKGDYITAFAVNAVDGDTLGTIYPKNSVLSQEAKAFIKKTLPANDIHKIIALDDWIANCDRNTGNLIISKSGRGVVIDHTHCLGSNAWKANLIDKHADFRNIFEEIMLDALARPYDTLSIVECLKDHYPALGDCVFELKFWLQRLLNLTDLSTALDFISYRSTARIDVKNKHYGLLGLAL